MRQFENLKIICLVFLMISISWIQANAQCTSFPAPVQTGNRIENFVPKGWYIKDSTIGDFNQDQLEDVVLVLASTRNDADTNFEECHRPVLVLQKTNAGYKLSTYSKEGVLCKNCGGVFGDPFDDISLKKNVLKITHYGGSAWRWGQDYTFRYQNGDWYLIGYNSYSYWSVGECEDVLSSAAQITDVNFSTSKVHIVRTNENSCKPYEDKWLTFPKKPLVSLGKFSVAKDYSPIQEK